MYLQHVLQTFIFYKKTFYKKLSARNFKKLEIFGTKKNCFL